MTVYTDAMVGAFHLLFGGDAHVWEIIFRSIWVSGQAVLIATVVGVPLGYLLGMSRFAGRGVLMVFVNTAMGFPPVVVGLYVFMALSNAGPLGSLELLFTVPAMVIAQLLLATPLVMGVTAAAVASVPRDLRLQVRALGASRSQEGLAVLKEARRGVMASVIAGFGGIISEVGAVGIVGGSAVGYTEVMTTAIMAYVRQGNFQLAMSLGLVLIGIALMVNVALTTIQNLGVVYER